MRTSQGRGKRDPHVNETVVRLWGVVDRAEIARQLDISRQRVSRIAKLNGLPPLPRKFWGRAPAPQEEDDATTPQGRDAAN